ncbi:hypothetical protein N7447_001847 [Penicillium robsamsonii]|uniref:uncharacterized protein n=1 Tax=Penicillium robsamsonii TaxID=1792511 RepID=UPI0025492A1D|nr:uncharacterized protein N7447_001847 [Penicillium robsamsonii]KAJ5835821.1 hypothetical protein N7447_001847 [Penicillium robsamsonii]
MCTGLVRGKDVSSAERFDEQEENDFKKTFTDREGQRAIETHEKAAPKESQKIQLDHERNEKTALKDSSQGLNRSWHVWGLSLRYCTREGKQGKR